MIPSRRLRILALNHTATLGGGELALSRLLAAVPTATASVRVLLFADGPLMDRLAAQGVRVRLFPVDSDLGSVERGHVARISWRTFRRAVTATTFVVRLGGQIRRLRPDVVYANSLKAGVLGGLAARLVGVPLVWHVRDRISADYMPTVTTWLVRLAIRALATEVVANSQATASLLDRDGVVIAHSGYIPAQALSDFGARPPRHGPPVVGLLGRISPTKGQLQFVRAARCISDQRPDVRFRITGSPMFGSEDYADAVRAEISRLGLAEKVEITPFVDDPVGELDRMTVCVHASPVPEPFGQVVLEAMLRGVSVVATDAGGVPEILRDGPEMLGKLIPPGDEAAMARAVLALLEDLQGASYQARRAYLSARRRFPVEVTARQVSGAWRRAAEHGR